MSVFDSPAFTALSIDDRIDVLLSVHADTDSPGVKANLTKRIRALGGDVPNASKSGVIDSLVADALARRVASTDTDTPTDAPA